MKIVSIHQPAYLPWLGYFHKMMVADTFVILDHVQFEKNSFINRNKIVQPDGREMWLTVPVLSKEKPTINDILIDQKTDWPRKHLRALELCYSNCPYWKNARLKWFFDYFYEEENEAERTWLNSALGAVNGYLYGIWGIFNPYFMASKDYDPPLTKTKSDLVLEICQRESADIYFSGALGKGYLEEEKFEKDGIKIVYQDYKHPVYEQYQLKNQNEFHPFMSVIDLLLNHGPKSKEIIMESNMTKEQICKQ